MIMVYLFKKVITNLSYFAWSGWLLEWMELGTNPNEWKSWSWNKLSKFWVLGHVGWTLKKSRAPGFPLSVDPEEICLSGELESQNEQKGRDWKGMSKAVFLKGSLVD
jgi:hypothetical protein